MTLRRDFLFWAAAAATTAVAATGCGGTDQVNLGDSGSGADVTTPPPDAGPPPDDASPGDGSLPPSDGSTQDGTVPDSGPFSPLDLPGLALWLDAEHKTTLDVNSRLQTWGDLSGNANDATQAGVNSRPTVSAQAINNLPAVHFEGIANAVTGPFLSIKDSATLQWGTGDYTLAVVGRFSNNTAGNLTTGIADFYWKSTYTGNGGAGVGLLGNIPTAQYTATVGLVTPLDAADYVFTATPYNDGAGRLFLTRRAGSTLELRVNASSVATQTAPNAVNVSAPNTPVFIGGLNNGYYYRLAGDIAEMIAVKGAISDGDLGLLETYLKGKYGL